MKGVLISIQPKWVEKIAKGEKTIEVRKSRPKLETPFKCYIYCTNNRNQAFYFEKKACNGLMAITGSGKGKIIGEFVCDRIDNYECELWNDEAYELIRQFNYDEYGEIEYEHGAENNENCEMLNKACLTWQDIRKYLGQGLNNCYAWHISNLKIYDKPKELSEFKKENFCYKAGDIDNLGCWEGGCVEQELGWCDGRCSQITRPPQSWCYVEVENV